MVMDPLDVDLDEPPPRPAARAAQDARPAWMGFLGGVVVLIAGIAVAVGIWHVVDDQVSEMTVTELAEAEALLDQLGFPPGLIDGVIDEVSRNAIRDFQVTAGLVVDGKMDVALLDELRAAKAELDGN